MDNRVEYFSKKYFTTTIKYVFPEILNGNSTKISTAILSLGSTDICPNIPRVLDCGPVFEYKNRFVCTTLRNLGDNLPGKIFLGDLLRYS